MSEMKKMSKIYVIGGCIIDIQGAVGETLRLHDSNPGKIAYSYGGVARNVAENLAHLEEDVYLVSVLGTDVFGENMYHYCTESGIKMDYVLRSNDYATSSYMAILDEDREMYVAVVDTSILALLTKEYIESVLDKITEEDILIVDTNLDEDLIQYIVGNSNCPLYLDPISTKKAEKIKDCLGAFHFLKPNNFEAETLSGISVKNEKEILDFFIAQGVKEVAISMGEDGVIASNGVEHIHIRHERVTPVNPTGAGDSFMAAYLWARRQGKQFQESLEIACAVAICTLLDVQTVTQTLSCDRIEQVRKEMNIRGERIC